MELGASGVIPDGSTVIVGGTLDLNGFAETIGNLSGGGTVNSDIAGAVTLTIDGGAGQTFSGAIQNGSGTVSLTKQGAATQTFSGANLYTGLTLVSAGTLAYGANGCPGQQWQ